MCVWESMCRCFQKIEMMFAAKNARKPNEEKWNENIQIQTHDMRVPTTRHPMLNFCLMNILIMNAD